MVSAFTVILLLKLHNHIKQYKFLQIYIIFNLTLILTYISKLILYNVNTKYLFCINLFLLIKYFQKDLKILSYIIASKFE